MMKVLAIMACVLFLQGCIHKIVTVPVKIAYKTTKGVVKGKKKGTATITVTSNGVSKKFKVKVK